MADDDENAPLTADDILTFGPVVEAQVWTPTFISEARAPIAQAAGRPKFGPVFNSEGVGKAVLIRPCVSRGKRIRGLPPIYSPTMLEGAAPVFAGWPMYLDHVPAELAATAAKRGRSVKELGGQVIRPYFGQNFVQEYDADFGYQPGAVLAEVWATKYLRELVGENPDLLHTSIAAWPTSGKPGTAPWNSKVKGMMIEGIRRQPQGSVDFVPRGGAGGRLLPADPKVAEGIDPDERAWPEPGWRDDDVRLVVSLAESFYDSAQMTGSTSQQPDFSTMTPDALRAYIRESAPHLTSALAESATPPAPAPAPAAPAGLTADDVQRMIAEARSDGPTAEEFEQQLEEKLAERDEQRSFAAEAARLIEAAEGIPKTWKADLTNRYALLPEGPAPSLLVEADFGGEGGAERDALTVLRENVMADLDHARELIAEATGKPRVTGEGGATRKAAGDERSGREGGGKVQEGETPMWRSAFAEMGIVESEEKALAIHGVDTKVEG